MDAVVAQAMAKWPNVPAVYGWLALDRRGNWLIKGERIANQALRDFISRNYAADDAGRWYFQNGPQRVYVTLAYTPLVVHYEGDGVVALLDDRDLARYADSGPSLQRITGAEIARRFHFVRDPKPT